MTDARRLITGHTGFVGQHALNMWPQSLVLPSMPDGKNMDLRNKDALTQAIQELAPDEVIHLAGISFVPDSIKDPRLTYEVNFLGTLNLLEALKASGFKGKFLFVSSSDPYGLVANENLPIKETLPLAPRNPYAVSKAAAEALCFQWSQTADFEIMIARPFNHIGPGQSEKFVVSDFAKQIVQIARNNKNSDIYVGNIDVTRDFSDVRDVLRAYEALLAKGTNANIYNICSGREISIRSILEMLIDLSGKKINICKDSNRWRPSDQNRVSASYEKIKQTTGWEPIYSIEESVKSVYQFWEKIHVD